ncbi:MAG TPA: hypothetical protein VG942_13395 [Hyphomonadaceae bacterium]|nr:hypothetical protein [Hyphomonadaceae bacterium]
MAISRRSLFALFIATAVIAVAPARANPPAEGEGAKVDDQEVARSLTLDGLVFPVFNEKGALKNYLFVSARMLVGPGKDPWKYREKGHFIRDALIRASHRTSFNLKGDVNKLDEKLAAAECLKAANDAVGEKDALVSMTFTQIASQGGVH